MERMVEIRITKSILLIPERVLWKYIPADELEAGIKRGKTFKRAERAERWKKSRTARKDMPTISFSGGDDDG